MRYALKTPHDAKKARLLFVAYKFETGYDNSNLTYLYILRQLSGTGATQLLLRHCDDWASSPAGKRTRDYLRRIGR